MNTFLNIKNIEAKKVLIEKRAQYECCKLSFIWRKMRTITWETA